MQKDQLLVILERMERKLDLVVAGQELLRSEIHALAHKKDERFDLADFMINVFNVPSPRYEAHQKRYRVSE